ncbi:MAG: hypothetical protein WCH44_05160 [Betaproteobacteria bacterium]
MKKFLGSMLRFFKWLLLGTVGLVVLVLGCWFLLPDQALNPEARKILEAQPVVPAQQNAYYALWGLTASPELDAFAVGRKVVDAQVAAVREKGYGAQFDPASIEGTTTYRRRVPAGTFCKSRGETAHCLTALRAHRGELLAELAAKDVYVRRYRGLRTYPHFEEAMAVTSAAPTLDWSGIREISELVDASIAFDMERPAQRVAALTDLLNEIKLWRLVGNEADLLIDRMAPAALMYSKYRLLSELLAEYPEIASEQGELVAQMSAPLTAADTDLRRALNGEFRGGAFLLQSLDSKGLPYVLSAPDQEATTFESYITRRLFKPQATINLNFENLSAVAEFYAGSAAQIQSGRDAFSKTRDKISYFEPRWWSYNPIGKILASVAQPDIGRYSDQLHDLLGYTRLLELQRQIAMNRLARDQVCPVVANAGVGLREPYTGQSMNCDSVKQIISFAPKGSNYTKPGVALSVTLTR